MKLYLMSSSLYVAIYSALPVTVKFDVSSIILSSAVPSFINFHPINSYACSIVDSFSGFSGTIIVSP